jgi:GntR family transcriptional regulator/MocR family aminotransferase
MSHPLERLVDKSAPTAKSKQRHLYEHYLSDIRSGRLPPGTRLPSSRQLADQLGLSRITVQSVYEALIAEGYLTTRQGAGTFVISPPGGLFVPNAIEPSIETPVLLAAGHAGERPRRLDNAFPKRLERTNSRFLPANPDLEAFPYTKWRKCYRAALNQTAHFRYPPLSGTRSLQEQIAEYLGRYRGVVCRPEQVMITTGSQQALYLILQLIAHPDSLILLEPAGFAGVDQILALNKMRTEVVDFHKEDHNAWSSEADIAIITPSRSFPLGETLGLDARNQILVWVTQGSRPRWIVEDDYDSEFIFSGHAMAALQGMDRHKRVIYTGTFSRTLFPGIRLGYAVFPDSLIESALKLKAVMDGGMNTLAQTALALFMEEGHYERHLRRMRKHYQAKQTQLHQSLAKHLPELKQIPNQGGMHDTFLIDKALGLTDLAIVEAAKEHGFGLRALSTYYRTPNPPNGLVIGFAGCDSEQIPESARALSALIRHLQTQTE